MLLELPEKILAYNQPIDMRKSFDGLLGIIQSVLKEDPLASTLYLFINRRGNYLKGIYWDRTGHCLFAKRLERGKFKFIDASLKQELTEKQLKLILDGIQLGRRGKMR